jgi:Clp amino terminal domain, pathogenicity island component
MAPSPLTLHDAVHWVDTEAKDPDPLTRLQTASVLVQSLAEVGDAALGYFVDQARHAGHSWSEIGDALGVSKQAAQQKHTVRLSLGPNAPTFEHLTPRARQVVTEAERIARNWGHGYVGTEHLLLALYSEPEGIAARILVDLEFPQKTAESEVARRVERGPGEAEGDLIFTPRVIAAFSGALSSALQMNHNYIGTEHLLLGLVQGDGVAAVVLRDSGLTQDVLVRDVTNRLARYVEGGEAVKVPGKRAAGKASASPKRGATKAGATRKAGATTKSSRR